MGVKRRGLLFCACAILSSLCACDEKEEGRGSGPAASASVGVAIVIEGGVALDPPRPSGDLRADLDAFTTVEACAEKRAGIDPLVGDALDAIGYETFLRDACRMLDAMKAEDAKRCDAIDASSLRARCRARVAMVAGRADDCPLRSESEPALGREPACVAACMMHALTKHPRTGVVSWSGESCVGCRYCQIGCPYNIPKFEWTALNPRIIKCELCQHRDKGPACCEVCPRGAVIYGRRQDLLKEAHRRLEASPDRYVSTIFGEHDGGGTQVLYLSHVPFDKLGLPTLGDESLPAYTEGVQGALYRGFVAPLALFGGLGLAISRRARIDEETRQVADAEKHHSRHEEGR